VKAQGHDVGRKDELGRSFGTKIRIPQSRDYGTIDKILPKKEAKYIIVSNVKMNGVSNCMKVMGQSYDYGRSRNSNGTWALSAANCSAARVKSSFALSKNMRTRPGTKGQGITNLSSSLSVSSLSAAI
jgi:hypothetical protein